MSPKTESDPLAALAKAYGIATQFLDWKDNTVDVAPETLRAVLGALDVDVSSPEAIDEALTRRQEEDEARVLPPCLVVVAGDRVIVEVTVPSGTTVSLRIETEDGRSVEGEKVGADAPRVTRGGKRRTERFDVGSELPLGYHEIIVDGVTDEPFTSTLVVTPQRLGLPESVAQGRMWGLATQLYSVRSHQSWGVGDLVDLRDLAVWSASEHEADYVLVNPLHAAEPDVPMQPSPYLPTSRRFFNPLYLRLERIEEFATAPEDVRSWITSLASTAHEQLDGLDRIDRDTAWSLKRDALRSLFDVPRTPGREAAFSAYREEMGEGLLRFATWCVLAEEFGLDRTGWPKGYLDPSSAEVEAFRVTHAERVDFQAWLQWCLDEQLRDVQAAAVTAGMRLGVVHDLAVGVNPNGADAWASGDAFAHGVHVGAPPDQFSQLGQDWGQPPLRPDRLRETAYRPFRDMLSTILRHSGGVRVDHILGLFRLWWVPEGATPKDGTYVTYDHEAMIGILALEAHRAGALVVGEDLGTLEPWVQTYLAERGLLGTSILWFEQDWDANEPLPPEAWRELCLASVTTHDLPPTAGYLEGAHVRLRDELGLLSEPLDQEMARDEADRRRWREFLVAQGLLDSADAPNERVLEALHAFLLTTPSRMLNVALVDAVGDKRVQNQPGTADEYPNWRVPLAGPDGDVLWLEDVFTDERAAKLLGLFAGLREDETR